MNADLTSPLVVVLPLAAFMLLFFAALFLVLRRMQKRQAAAVLKRFEGHNLRMFSSNANYFGLLSRGRRQLRGNGVLALSDDGLFFQLRLSRNRIEIAPEKIKGVSSPRIFRLRSILRPLLRVDFINEHGRPDAAAWYVENLSEWKAAIENIKVENTARSGD